MNDACTHGGTVLSVARQLGVPPESILDFSASINPLGPAPGVRQAAAAAFDLAGCYPEIDSPAVVHALAAYHSLTADNIAVANGSTELIYLIPRLFRRAAGRALLIAPAFSEYANALELAGWHFDYLTLSPKTGFAIDFERLSSELERGYDLLFFCNPGNPTGKLYDYEDVAAIARHCRKAGAFFVLDEAFIDFAEDHSAKHLLTTADNGLILRSMTKFFGFPGIRVGYSIASPSVTARIRRFLPPWSVGVVPQAAALAALANGKHYCRTAAYVARERRHLAKGLAGCTGIKVFESGVNYLLLRLTNGLIAAELQARLLQKRILIRDCSNFNGLDEHFFRIAVRKKSENRQLLQAVAEALNTLE